MRTRILCLVLFGLLLVPALGFAKGAEIDPSGQAATVEGSSVETAPAISVEGQTAAWTAGDSQAVDRAGGPPGKARDLSPWATVLRWLEALISPF